MIAALVLAGWGLLSVPAACLLGRFIRAGSKSAGGTSSTGEWSSRRRNTSDTPTT